MPVLCATEVGKKKCVSLIKCTLTKSHFHPCLSFFGISVTHDERKGGAGIRDDRVVSAIWSQAAFSTQYTQY